MGLVELNWELTDEQRAMRDMARKFGAEVMRPAALALDKLADPQAVIAKDSVLWSVLRAFRELGFHKAGIPPQFGGLGVDPLTSCLVVEELGYAAPGLAISLSSARPFLVAMFSPDPEIQAWTRQFCADTAGKMVGCWAITEPDHGSDWIFTENPEVRTRQCGPSVKAVKDGDEYVINGQKAAWVSNGTIATHAALFLGLEPGEGMASIGVATIPLDLPGVSRGKPLDKMGQRELNQGEIFFDNVRIPQKMMVFADPDSGAKYLDATLTAANAGMGSLFVGLSQAALDEALRYAQERVQGGKPLIEHQHIQLKLFDMFTRVEAARSLSRRVTCYNAANLPGLLQYSSAAKIMATETALAVSAMAVRIFGGAGVSRDYAIEKIFRDAKASIIEDGVNETLALGSAKRLV